MDFEHGEISIWSEVKLAIIKEYASTYTKILDAQRRERIPSLPWFYIDGYVGSGHRPDVFTFADAFRQRLEKAGFKFVPRPMAMKTKSNSVIYYV